MDTRTGEIASLDFFKKHLSIEEFSDFVMPVNKEYLSVKNQKELDKNNLITISARSRCPCGSGKRFKSCCMYKRA